jgi:hypothetical protein
VIVSEVAGAERTGRSECSSEVAQDERTGRGRAGASGCRCDCQDFVKTDRGNIVTTTKDYADEIDMTATALARDCCKEVLPGFLHFFWCFRKFSTSGRGRVLKSKDHNFFYLIAAVAE